MKKPSVQLNGRFVANQVVRVGILLLILFCANSWVHQSLAVYQKAHPLKGISVYDMTKACQQISSQATQSGWTYKGCLQELEQSLLPSGINYST